MPRKKTKNPVMLFYPNLLSVRDLKLEVTNYYKSGIKPGGYQCKTKDRDYYLFLHILLEPYLCLDERDTKFVQIHSTIVQHVFGRDYNKIINALVKHEYILVDDDYCEYYGICKSYAVHPRLIDACSPLLTVSIEYDTVLQNKLNRIATLNLSKPLDVEAPEPLDAGRRHVILMTSQLILKPSPEALAYVKKEYELAGNPNAAESFFHHFNYNPLRGCKVDRFGRRVHSIITNMPKILRACLRFKSAPDMLTVEWDIVNSQPFFLSAIDSNLIALFAPECRSAVDVYDRYRAEPDYLKFCALCEDGKLYEEFIDLYYATYNKRYGESEDEARDITKKLVYSVFYSDYAQIEKGLDVKSRTEFTSIKKNFFKMFRSAYASVFKLFSEIKALYWNFTVNSKGIFKQYANNCLLAQRIESGVIYERLVPNLLAYVDDLVTVHDCVIVKACDMVTVKAAMTDTFAQLGLNPKFK